MTGERQLAILKVICDLPTAPYCEQHVIAWLLAWAKSQGETALRARRDAAGNVYLEYRRGNVARRRPLVIEAHMDHPGFVVVNHGRGGIEAEFRGGVKPSHFKDAQARFWVAANGRWVRARVQSVRQIKGRRFMTVQLKLLESQGARLPPGTLGMWDLPDAQIGGAFDRVNKLKRPLFAARVCDDLAGVAAIVCLLEELLAHQIPGHVIGLCTRAEEVGFAGVLAVCEHGWIPKNAAVIGLETSKGAVAAGGGMQGLGPIIRAGDRTGLFSAGLTHFIMQAAGHIADADASFQYQRKLMDGGTCNSTAFMAYDYDAAGICLALGNYHNQHTKGELGWRAGVGGRTGKGIASETIHCGDFLGMVRILVETARRIGKFRRGFGIVRKRLAKMHRKEQRKLLYATVTGHR